MNTAIPIKSHLVKTLIAFIIICSIASCSKDESPNPDPGSTPNPPVVTKKDTLTTGWQKIKAVTDSLAIVDIFFQDNSTGYLLSLNNFSIYKTTDGGTNWTKLTGYFTDASNLFVTADGKLFVPTSGNIIYRSTNGGAYFEQVPVATSLVTDVYFIDNNIGYAPCINGLLQTADGGASWSLVNPMSGLGNLGGSYGSLSFANATTGWVSWGDKLYKSGADINHWDPVNMSTAGGNVFSVFAVSASLAFAGSLDGKLYKYYESGPSFSVVTTFNNDKPGYLDTHFFDENNGYACYGKKIYKTTDGGNAWQTVVTLASENFLEIHFTDATHGWACTDKGSILKFN